MVATLLLYSGVAIVHGADFGCRAYTPSNALASPENQIVMATMTAPADGIVDSLGFVITGALVIDFPTRMALYKINASSPPPDSLKDSTAAFDVLFGTTSITYSKPVLNGASIYTDQAYSVAVWSATGVGSPSVRGTSTDTVCVGNGAIKEYRVFSATYSGTPWPDTLNASKFTGYFMAYVVYHTVASGSTPSRRRRVVIGGAGMIEEDLGLWIPVEKEMASR